MPHSNAKSTQLPIPSKSDSEFSNKLKEKIINRIKTEGDLPFIDYMNMALYEEGLGYYVSGLRKFGAQGDFVTSPEISTLFGQTLAKQIAEVFDNSAINNVFELGAGTGKLAVDILTELSALNNLPDVYYILDISGEMQQRQQQLLAEKCPSLIIKVKWIKAWPEGLNAVVVANEVLDAMPVERFLHYEDNVLRQFVSVKDNKPYKYRRGFTLY
jgi:SAM-dependent MidA family methyltransferase